MSLLSRLRGLLHGDDARPAYEEEAAAIADAKSEADEHERRVRRAYGDSTPGRIVLGNAVGHGWPVGVPPEQLFAHLACVGPTSCGKTYGLTVLLMALIRGGVRSVILLDPKGEMPKLLKRAIIDVARALPPGERQALLGAVVNLDPFSRTVLPRQQILAPIPGLDPEDQAFEISQLVTSDVGQATGLRQDAIIVPVIECLIRGGGLPITVLPTVLERPELLDALAERYEPAELFRSTAAMLRKEGKDRIQGLRARARRLLRTRTLRACLGGSERAYDALALMNGRIACSNLAHPQGSPDLGTFACGMAWMQLVHAIGRRPIGSPPCIVIIDELPAFLKAGGARAAEAVEDTLRLARARNVALWMAFQDMASVARVPSLPDVLRTNCSHWLAYRTANPSDLEFLLVPSGRRPRQRRAAPWEEPKGGFLERESERALMREELRHMENRDCLFVDRRTGIPPIKMRSADLILRASDSEVAALDRLAESAPEVASVAELEAGELAVRRRVEALLGGSPNPSLRRRKGFDVG